VTVDANGFPVASEALDADGFGGRQLRPPHDWLRPRTPRFPPLGLIRFPQRRRLPFICSAADITALMSGARRTIPTPLRAAVSPTGTEDAEPFEWTVTAASFLDRVGMVAMLNATTGNSLPMI
jgi:hypothetical protein